MGSRSTFYNEMLTWNNIIEVYFGEEIKSFIKRNVEVFIEIFAVDRVCAVRCLFQP